MFDHCNHSHFIIMEHLLHHMSRLFDALHCRFQSIQEVRGRAQLGGAAKQPELLVVSCSSTSGSRKRRNVVAMTTDDHDAEVVMRRLRLWNSGEEDGRGLMDEACRLLQEKEASVEELEAAFAVFDRNGDGKVGAEELMGVMERLGLEEGARVEECQRMIAAYDEDGDGVISFREFKNMLVNSS